MLEADLSSGKGVLWLKSPSPASDGTLFLARYRMGQGKTELGADLFVHVVYGSSGDRLLALHSSSQPVHDDHTLYHIIPQ